MNMIRCFYPCWFDTLRPAALVLVLAQAPVLLLPLGFNVINILVVMMLKTTSNDDDDYGK